MVHNLNLCQFSSSQVLLGKAFQVRVISYDDSFRVVIRAGSQATTANRTASTVVARSASRTTTYDLSFHFDDGSQATATHRTASPMVA